MAAVEINFQPTDKQLRQFGLIGLFALPLIGWLFAGKPTILTWESADTLRIGAFATAGILFGLAACVKPGLLKWVFVTASVITFPIGFILGEMIMLSIYVLVFTPVALLFRAVGRDPLQRARRPDAQTYWQGKAQPKDAASYYRQS